MDAIQFIIKTSNKDDKNIKILIENFKNNIKKDLDIIKTSNNDKDILISTHNLKGYFSNKKLQYLLRNNQKPINIKKKFDIIIEYIDKELELLD